MGTTPMLEQYLNIKRAYPGAILFFHLGDFYEMFNDDALIASRELELTLTSREAGKDNRLPMCGVPVQAASTYIGRLVERGYKVAICEQVEDPREAKGLVRREVVRVVTPGTFTEGAAFEKGNGFIVALAAEHETFGLAVADLSTGEFQTTQFSGPAGPSGLADELFRLAPLEIVFQPGLSGRLAQNGTMDRVQNAFQTDGDERSFRTELARRTLLEHFQVSSLEGFGCADLPVATAAAGALLSYLRETQKTALPHITRLQSYSTTGFMYLDSATRRNLELTRTMREGEYRGTLLWVLDATTTSMGRRLLRRWVEQPLLDTEAIGNRLESVDNLASDNTLRASLRDLLSGVYDLERLTGRVAVASANARDLMALRTSLERLPDILNLIGGSRSNHLASIAARVNPLAEVASAIAAAIPDEPPLSLKDGGIIRPGYNEELDQLRQAAGNAREWLNSLEARERERTGIKSLKVGFNQVFGYYIEITRSNLSLVPSDYQRKQTLSTGERFITPELKQYEDIILGAAEKSAFLEYELFVKLRDEVAAHVPELQRDAASISELDVLASLAEVAVRNGYVRPEIGREGEIFIKDGRHPVVERMLPNGAFVPNDSFLDLEENRLHIITGPNMAGKSTYLRQVALIVLLAQMGSFVPASFARIGLVDRVFTRVGASDDLATGQSTFMVEMHELANILNHASKRSLLVLDEIGRGTSTFDGLSIAWATVEFLQDPVRGSARTLFATHYHELTELEGLLPGIRNMQVAVKKNGDDITFLRKIVPGGADRSYGIEVARLAGLPQQLLARAGEILNDLEKREDKQLRTLVGRKRGRQAASQLSLFHATEEQVIDELRAADIAKLSPIEALNLLHTWQQRIGARTDECAATQEVNDPGTD